MWTLPTSKLYQKTPLPVSGARKRLQARKWSRDYGTADMGMLRSATYSNANREPAPCQPTGVAACSFDRAHLTVATPHSPPESVPPFHQGGVHMRPAPEGSFEPSCEDG
jgi:hypothetical protein